jgi:uncharacterized membrane protein YbaN (DUF454 family)
MTRHISNVFGLFFLALGIVGAFLPLLPTTPFILLASYFFAISNPKLAAWLQASRWGPYIRQWQSHRVIPPRAKFLSTTMMALSVYITWPKLEKWGILAQLAFVFVMLACAVWVWSYKSYMPKQNASIPKDY